MRIARVHAQALAVRKSLAHLAVAVGMGLGEPLGCLAFRLKVVHVEDNNAHGNSFTWVEKYFVTQARLGCSAIDLQTPMLAVQK